MPKAEKKQPAAKDLQHWLCPKCGTKLHPVQMELQPKICTSCGKGELKPVYK